jgi:hypothetical protein
MAEFSPENKPALKFEKTPKLKYLKARDVHMIDDALAQVGNLARCTWSWSAAGCAFW